MCRDINGGGKGDASLEYAESSIQLATSSPTLDRKLQVQALSRTPPLSKWSEKCDTIFDTQSLGASASITGEVCILSICAGLMSQFRKKIEPQDLSATRRRLQSCSRVFHFNLHVDAPTRDSRFSPPQKSSFIVGFLPTLVSRRIILIKSKAPSAHHDDEISRLHRFV